MELKYETITPATAEAWLNSNNANRSLRSGVVEKYADDMRNGRWTRCTVPIAFYEDGDLADGQHRLYAIIESGIPQQFIVVRGLKREDGLNIDTGLNRTLVDNGRISGVDPDLSNSLIAVCRGIAEGGRSPKQLSNAARIELVAKHREAGEWALAHAARGRGLRNAVILSAVGRAWYYEADKEKLARFCEVFSTGFANGESESAAIALRNHYMSRSDICTASLWRETFVKSQNAISRFMRGAKLTFIKPVADEVYPLQGARTRPAKTQRGTKALNKAKAVQHAAHA